MRRDGARSSPDRNSGAAAAPDLAALRTKPVINAQGAPAGLMMTHPSDASIAPAEVRTCAGYAEMTFDGWFAATSMEMRREGFFIRACGTLAALSEASRSMTPLST